MMKASRSRTRWNDMTEVRCTMRTLDQIIGGLSVEQRAKVTARTRKLIKRNTTKRKRQRGG